MKRVSLTFIFMFLVTSLVISTPVTVNAQSPSQLADLARFYPDNLPIFISFRTDDTAIHDADGLMRHIESLGHSFDLPEGGLPEGLDMIINDFFEGETFDSAIRTWLGDTIALGITDLDDFDDYDDRSDDILVAIDINGRDVAVNFLNNSFERYPRAYEVEVRETANYTLFELENDDDIYIAVFDDVMFIAEDDDLLPLQGSPRSTLADNSEFQATIALLPEDQYNFVFYVNMDSFSNEIRRELSNSRRIDQQELNLALNMLDSIGGQAFAGTILDDRSLVLDIAQRIEDGAFEEFGMNLSSAVIDPAFLNRVPAGTPLVIHSTDLKNSYDNFINTLRVSADISDETTIEEFERGLSQVEFGIRGLTGLELEEIVEWWTGDFVLYFKVNEHIPLTQEDINRTDSFPFDFAFIIEATDPAQANALLEGLANSIQAFSNDYVSIVRQDVAGADAIVITVQDASTPFPIELAIAANDEVFVAGTLSAVQHALSPDGSLLTDLLYLEAINYALPNSSQFWYASGENLDPLVNLLAGFSDNRQAREMRQALAALHSASISQSILADGTFLSRAVFTLP